MPTCHYFSGDLNASQAQLFSDIYFDTAADNLDFKWQHQYW